MTEIRWNVPYIMKKFISIALFSIALLHSAILLAQPRYRVFDFRDPKLRSFSVHIQSGTSNYFGDLCPTGDCYTNSKFNLGGGVNYRMNDYLFFNFNFQYYRIGGSDLESGNTGRLKRNLSFRSDNIEFSFLGHFEFLNYNTFRYLSRNEFPISMYAFLGFGVTTNSPKALYKGEYIALRPLKTEGVSYSSLAAILPFGLGISYKIKNIFAVSLQAGYRFTGTDYLDDVSTKYAYDPKTISPDDPLSLSYRGTEENFYGVGAKRGSPQKNDGYLLVDLKFEYFFGKVPFLNVASRGAGIRGRSSVSQPSRTVKKRK